MNVQNTKRRYILASVTLLLMVLRIASGYMHTDAVHHHDKAEVSSSFCAACELEATTLSDSFTPIILPVVTQTGLIPFENRELTSPILRPIVHFDLRGPPTFLG